MAELAAALSAADAGARCEGRVKRIVRQVSRGAGQKRRRRQIARLLVCAGCSTRYSQGDPEGVSRIVTRGDRGARSVATAGSNGEDCEYGPAARRIACGG